MGRETRCMAEIGDWVGDGRLLLEVDTLIFRGARRLALARSQIDTVRAEAGWLVVEYGDDRARFDLGHLAPSWVNAILHPRTRADKLDVTSSARVLLSGEHDADFVEEVKSRAASVTVDATPDVAQPRGGASPVPAGSASAVTPGSATAPLPGGASAPAAADATVIYHRVDDATQLHTLAALRERLAAGGVIWVIHRKGPDGVRHEAIADAARELGLVDTKSARFSDTHAALRLSVRRARPTG